VSFENLIGLILAAGLSLFMVAALLLPERF
jgi:K+-transporting ATPase KdpF subunit